MKTTGAFIVLTLALLSAPAFGDKRLDDAKAKVEEQLQKGHPDDALKTMQKVVDQNPTSPEALLAFALLQERLGNLDGAAESLTKSVGLGASAPGAVRAGSLAALASMDLRRGRGRDALAHAEEAQKLSTTPETLAVLARAQARALDANKGLETAQSAVAAHAASAATHEALGEALLAIGRTDEAASAFRKALELEPRMNWARIGLGQALLAQGKAAEAVAEARKASDADAKSGEAFAILGEAILAENPKNWNDAIAQAQQGAFLDPKSPMIQYVVGKIFEAGGNAEQAGVAYKRALDADPAYVPAQVALVVTQLRKKELDAAYTEAQKLGKEAPQNGDAQLLLGRIFLLKNEFLSAVSPLEKAATLLRARAEAHALLGTAYQYARRSEDAAAAYKRAVELAPNNLEYRTTYGLLLGVVGHYEAAITELKKVIATPGYKDAAAYVNLGWVYRNMKPPRTDESIAAYKTALEIDGKNGQTALGLGWAYSYTRLWDEAIAAFEKAVGLDPLLAGDAYDGIAWCYFFKRDMTHATASLQKAKAAGRNDTRLREQIEKVEKLIAQGKKAEEEIKQVEGPREHAGPDINALSAQLRSKDAAARKRAVQEFVAVGRDAVPFLVFALKEDPEWDVRTAAAAALGSLGPAAHDAVPTMKYILSQPKSGTTIMTPKEMREAALEEDFRRAIREALAKIERR